MKEIYIPWAKRAVKDALEGLNGADLLNMLTEEEKKKVDEVKEILIAARKIIFEWDADFDTGDFMPVMTEEEMENES